MPSLPRGALGCALGLPPRGKHVLVTRGLWGSAWAPWGSACSPPLFPPVLLLIHSSRVHRAPMGCQHCLRYLGPAVRRQGPPLRSLSCNWGTARRQTTACHGLRLVRGSCPAPYSTPPMCPQPPGYLTPRPSLIPPQSRGAGRNLETGQSLLPQSENLMVSSLSRCEQVGRRPRHPGARRAEV